MTAALLLLFLYILPIIVIGIILYHDWKNKGAELSFECLITFIPLLNIVGAIAFLFIVLRDDVDWKKLTVKLFGDRGSEEND